MSNTDDFNIYFSSDKSTEKVKKEIIFKLDFYKTNKGFSQKNLIKVDFLIFFINSFFFLSVAASAFLARLLKLERKT